MKEHFRHIFIQQVYKNSILYQRFMFSKDGTLLHDFVDDENLKSSFSNQQLHFFSHNFFDEQYNDIQRFSNSFFEDLLNSSESDSIVYDENSLITNFNSILYNKLFVEYDNLGFPTKVFSKKLDFVQVYQYDENYNLVNVNVNDIDIYTFQYVFYEDIYNLLNVQLLNI